MAGGPSSIIQARPCRLQRRSSLAAPTRFALPRRYRPADLGGTVVKVQLDRKATTISLLVVVGVRRDGQVLLAMRNNGREERGGLARAARLSACACVADAGFLIIDSAAGSRKPDRPLGDGAGPALHRPQASGKPAGPRPRKAPRGDLGRRHGGMIYAATPQQSRDAPGIPTQVAADMPGRGRQPGRGRRPGCSLCRAAVQANGLARTTNMIERLHEDFRRGHHDADGAILG